jgi:DNA polymerase I-like protein with 3'-5' exonuclease and polymerase domains
MQIVDLAQARELDGQLGAWAYNALDVTGTREIADNLKQELSTNGSASLVYGFERALQAPAFSMMMRGVRIDKQRRDAMIREAKQELKRADKELNAQPLVRDKWDGEELETGLCPLALGKHHKWPRGVPDAERKCERCGASRVKRVDFNANSPDATYHLLYDLNNLEPLTNKQGKESTDDDVLQRLAHKYPKLKPIIDRILIVRDKKKQLGSLLARLSPNGRYYSSFNVGTAWTGRFSSSKNPFGWGGNLQNVAPKHRSMFIADPGYELGYADYKQGESNIVAHLSGDERYIEAHRVGDVHTYVARLVWPELPWTGDLKQDKKVASRNPPWDSAEGHTYRFHSKGIQHGANFGRTPRGISMGVHIPLAQATTAYEAYMMEFDHIPAWQDHIGHLVHERQPLTNPFGRSLTLMGRPWDKATWRQGLSFLPQSTLADMDDLAMWYVWYDLEQDEVLLLAQVHDALLHEFPRGRLDLEREVVRRMTFPVPVTDFQGKTRVMEIGVESATGKTWGHKCTDETNKKCRYNPYGIDEGPIEEYLLANPI